MQGHPRKMEICGMEIAWFEAGSSTIVQPVLPIRQYPVKNLCAKDSEVDQIVGKGKFQQKCSASVG